MTSSGATAEATVRAFVRRVKHVDDLDLDAPLYADGIGLDSLETAELSATLEDDLGADPYSAGDMPQTARAIIAFYESASLS
jgi:acyl carrier protein